MVLLEWIGQYQYPEYSLLTRRVILFKTSHKPRNSSASSAESRSVGKLLATQFWIVGLFLYCCCCKCLRAHLKYPGKGVTTANTPTAWIGEFLGEAALHNPLLPSPACGECLPLDQPKGKDDPVAMKWRLEKPIWWCCPTVCCLAFSARTNG